MTSPEAKSPLFSFPERSLDAHYDVGETLGKGGFGIVYAATERALGRPVAIKRLLSDDDDRRMASFKREALTIAALNHPHILPLLAVGHDRDGDYLVLEYAGGGTARDRLNARGPLNADEVLLLAEKMGSALEYAHSRDVIHRDLKPQNILFTEAGEPKLADFGLARTPSHGESMVTVGGTPGYRPPEQEGGGTRFIDGRADLYALGWTLYNLATGKPPGHVDEERLVPILRPIIARCVEYDRERRYQSATEFLREVRAARMRLSAGRLGGWWFNPRRRYTAIGCVVVASLAAGVLPFLDSKDSSLPHVDVSPDLYVGNRTLEGRLEFSEATVDVEIRVPEAIRSLTNEPFVEFVESLTERLLARVPIVERRAHARLEVPWQPIAVVCRLSGIGPALRVREFSLARTPPSFAIVPESDTLVKAYVRRAAPEHHDRTFITNARGLVYFRLVPREGTIDPRGLVTFGPGADEAFVLDAESRFAIRIPESPGEYAVRVAANDAPDREFARLGLIVDRDGPGFTIVNPAPSPTRSPVLSTTLRLESTDHDLPTIVELIHEPRGPESPPVVASLTVESSGTTTRSLDVDIDRLGIPDGESRVVELSFSAVDFAGNRSARISSSVHVDRKPPTVDPTSFRIERRDHGKVIVGRCDEIIAAAWWQRGADPEQRAATLSGDGLGFEFTPPDPPFDPGTVRLFARDLAGNESKATALPLRVETFEIPRIARLDFTAGADDEAILHLEATEAAEVHVILDGNRISKTVADREIIDIPLAVKLEDHLKNPYWAPTSSPITIELRDSDGDSSRQSFVLHPDTAEPISCDPPKESGARCRVRAADDGRYCETPERHGPLTDDGIGTRDPVVRRWIASARRDRPFDRWILKGGRCGSCP